MEKINLNVIGKYYNLSDLKRISLGGQFSLCPIDAGALLDSMDSLILESVCQTEEITKNLPLLDFKTSKSNGKEFLTNEIKKCELGLGFGYAIRQNAGLVGMIMIDTPAFNKLTIEFEQWTISYFCFLENLGIISTAIPRILYLLKTQIKVKKLYALVSSNNSKSIHILQKFYFNEIQNTGWKNKNGGSSPRIFCCNLESLNF